MSLSPGSKLGPYEILSLLGAGGMGEVYRARDPRLARNVAIKVLPADRMADEDRRRRFVQEARAASALNHPNIVTVHEIDCVDGIDFIVMEYLPGKTLDLVIPAQGMRFQQVLHVAIPMADALARAHAAGIVHRDLKPTNVMVANDGLVKVLDFGLAKLVAPKEASPGSETETHDGPLSRPGSVAGTIGYMSPEQAAGEEVDARSDVFSFGAVLYEMVTGRRAFAGKSTAEILAALMKDQPKPPSALVSEVPKELERLIHRCLRKEPDRRFQHMLDVKVELQEIEEESGSGPAALAVPVRRGPWLWLPVGLAGALASAAAGFLVWRSGGSMLPPPVVVPLTSTPGIEVEPSFSPDGNQVAFAWQGEALDNWDIYVKMVGSPEMRRLTTNADLDRVPCWSPDGRWIAFVRTSGEEEDGTIHLVAPLGGPDRTLSDQRVADAPLSWSPDGRWLATGEFRNASASKADVGASRGIRLVAVPGGQVRAITSPSGPTYHADPAFSPDGRRLAYASCLSVFACQIDVQELGPDYSAKGTARRLTRKVVFIGGLAWSRDGKSVVYSDLLSGRLWRVGSGGDQPPERIEIAGSGARSPTIASARDRLAFLRFPLNRDIYRLGGGGPAEVVAASSVDDYNPSFSADGRRFAFSSHRGGDGLEIWLAAADGSNPTQLTRGPGVMQGSPRWSPDGRRIAFDSAGEDGHWDIWTMAAGGGSLQRLTSDAADDNLPSYSRDGRFVYFCSNRAGAYNVWRIPATGGPEEQVTRTGGWLSYESADGKTLFFKHHDGEGPLLAAPVGGGSERRVVDCVSAGFSFAVGLTGVYHLGCGGTPSTPVPLWLRDPATSRDRLLAKIENAGGLTVSPDGETILYAKLVGEVGDLMVIENFR